MGDELLLNDIHVDVETLMDKADFEIDMQSLERLQGLQQQDQTLRDKEKLEAREKPGISEKEQVD